MKNIETENLFTGEFEKFVNDSKKEIKRLNKFISKMKTEISKEFIRFRMVMLFFLSFTALLPLFDTIEPETIKSGLYAFGIAFIGSYPVYYIFVYITLFNFKRKVKWLNNKINMPETYLNLSNQLKSVSSELMLYPENVSLQRKYKVLQAKIKAIERHIEYYFSKD